MRFLVDAGPAVLAERTGIGTYVWNLLRNLPVVDPGNEYLAWYVHFRSIFEPRRHFDGLGVIEKRVVLPSRLTAQAGRFRIPLVELVAPCDVVFGTNFVPPSSLRTPSVVTVHDLAFRLFPETAPQAVPWWTRAVEHSVRSATRVVVPSEATRADLLRLYEVDPRNVVVVPLGVDHAVFSPASDERIDDVRARFGIHGPYLVFLGRHQRKNFDGMLRAFAAIPDQIRPGLVVTGSAPWTRDGSDHDGPAMEAVPERVREQVSFVGFVSSEDAAALLSGSLGLAFPTLYEGFGLPALEAMACGAPVLTSNLSSLPELVGDGAVLVDPREDTSVADGLLRIVTDGSLRDRLRAAGLQRAARYEWGTTAKATADVLHEAAAAGR
jgi:glycosyltransferase involved in cell wall biosynthesis